METPASTEFTPETGRARELVENFLLRGRGIVTGGDALGLLATYGVGVVDARETRSPQPAVAAEVCPLMPEPSASATAEKTGRDAGEGAAQRSPGEMLAGSPRTRTESVLAEPLFCPAGASQVKVGVADDPVFGPVITLGQVGTVGDLTGDLVVGLPPLNSNLAGEMISRARIAKLLRTAIRRRPCERCA